MSRLRLLNKAFGLLAFTFVFTTVFQLEAIGAENTQPDKNSSTEVKVETPSNDSKVKGKEPVAESKTETSTGEGDSQPVASELKEVKNPTMKHVQQYYNAGNYQAVLAAVKKMKPTCMTHYYTGLAYQHTNRHYKAAIEYNYVKNNAKDAKLKYNAAVALKSLYRQKKQLRANRRDKRNRLGEYQRYSEDCYPGGPGPGAVEYTRKQMELSLKRRPNQDRYWRSYKIPKDSGYYKSPRYGDKIPPYQK